MNVLVLTIAAASLSHSPTTQPNPSEKVPPTTTRALVSPESKHGEGQFADRPAAEIALAETSVAAASALAPPQDEIVVTARSRPAHGDPLQAVNAKSFAVTQAVDEALIGPVALGYKHVVPEPIRDGLRNFAINLHEPIVFVNFLLQMKPGKAGETAGRFLVNSTVGVAGLLDIAKRRPIHLPRRRNGFADTLGYYGVGPGPFLFLPLIGPTTVRDLFGGGIDRLILPLTIGPQLRPFVGTVPVTGVASALDRRDRLDEQLQGIRQGSTDPYQSRRALYLRKRQAEIDGLRPRRDDAPLAVSRGRACMPTIAQAKRELSEAVLSGQTGNQLTVEIAPPPDLAGGK